MRGIRTLQTERGWEYKVLSVWFRTETDDRSGSYQSLPMKHAEVRVCKAISKC